MFEHYIVAGIPGEVMTAACGVTVSPITVPPDSVRRCGTCLVLVDTMDRVA